MKLSFFGAAHAVTGSCHCLEANGRKILIDCGLQQGRDEHDDNALDFAPGQIDYCLVTHAHIDHSGRLPLLVKEGFQGQIITTRLTAQLLSIMLRDSAHIQESDAQWQNQKGKRPAVTQWSLSTLWLTRRPPSSSSIPWSTARCWICARGSGSASPMRSPAGLL